MRMPGIFYALFLFSQSRLNCAVTASSAHPSHAILFPPQFVRLFFPFCTSIPKPCFLFPFLFLQSPYRTAKVSFRIKADILSLTLCGNFQTHCRFVFSLRQPSAHLTSLQRTTFIQKIPVSPEFFTRRAHLLLKRSLPSLFLKTAAFFRIFLFPIECLGKVTSLYKLNF